MQIIDSIESLRDLLVSQSSVALVPTMGNLHEGHLALMSQARQHGKLVVASIFVNPLQFGPSEDFDRYPRTLAEDCNKLQGVADVVFAPSINDMYPQRQTVFVELPEIANELCGASRPGHFRGMATVVLKLLSIVRPQAAFFGKKDYQQLHIIRQMVTQFNLPVRIVGGETVRAADGLALSSRNQYLSEEERQEARRLSCMLREMRLEMLAGDRSVERLQQAATEALASRGWLVDYVSVRDQLTLQAAQPSDRELVILAAATLGKTRLLDNIEVYLPG
ncbi:MAG: pantoate--beta-alanine ligase [Gallionella sp.]|nr:pantoate--beta-alanine ligase [Gallionella sp.]